MEAAMDARGLSLITLELPRYPMLVLVEAAPTKHTSATNLLVLLVLLKQ